jgi:hypothetical protein
MPRRLRKKIVAGARLNKAVRRKWRQSETVNVGSVAGEVDAVTGVEDAVTVVGEISISHDAVHGDQDLLFVEEIPETGDHSAVLYPQEISTHISQVAEAAVAIVEGMHLDADHLRFLSRRPDRCHNHALLPGEDAHLQDLCHRNPEEDLRRQIDTVVVTVVEVVAVGVEAQIVDIGEDHTLPLTYQDLDPHQQGSEEGHPRSL